MKCPSCAKEGKDVTMKQASTGSTGYILWLCPENIKHWEVEQIESDGRK